MEGFKLTDVSNAFPPGLCKSHSKLFCHRLAKPRDFTCDVLGHPDVLPVGSVAVPGADPAQVYFEWLLG